MTTTAEQNESQIRDKYCWICHDFCSQHDCSTCFRTYHDKCLKEAEKKQGLKHDLLTCPVCVTLKHSKELFMKKQSVLNNLKHVKDEIQKYVPFNVLLDLPDFTGPTIVNPINLNDILRKIEDGKYSSLEAFLVDINTILHNCKIQLRKGERNEIIEIADNLMHFCQFECQCISACANCYENYYALPGNEFRTTVCRVPHMLLWAKLERKCEFWPAKMGFTHWPAKLLAVDSDGIATIVFFGDSKFDDVRIQDCYVYSSNPPSSTTKSTGNIEDMKAALNEVDLYIKNVGKKFGRVKESWPNTLFVPSRIDAHMEAMFPDYKGQIEPNGAKNTKNTGADNDEWPAKRTRFARRERMTRKNVDFTPDSNSSAKDGAGSDQDSIDEISETMVKLHEQIDNLNNAKKRKIDDLNAELERIKKINGEIQAKNNELCKQMNDALLKQTKDVADLKNNHTKEVEAIQAVVAKAKKLLQQKDEDLKAKDAVIAKIDEQNSIITKILDKAKRQIDELKECMGCQKLLDGLCHECVTVCADISGMNVSLGESSSESSTETSIY